MLIGQRLTHRFITYKPGIFRYCGISEHGYVLISCDERPNEGPMSIHPDLVSPFYTVAA